MRQILDARRFEIVATLCELIIPQTDTPGARAAGVPEYVEFTLRQASAAVRRRFIEGVEWIDREANGRFGRPFIELDQDHQIALLKDAERGAVRRQGGGIGQAFFKDVKDRTIYAYYTSAAGLLDELGYPRTAP